MQVVINGESRAVDRGIRVSELLVHLGLLRDGVAVAVNGDVIPRGAHGGHSLEPGDRVEIIQAVGGG